MKTVYTVEYVRPYTIAYMVAQIKTVILESRTILVTLAFIVGFTIGNMFC